MIARALSRAMGRFASNDNPGIRSRVFLHCTAGIGLGGISWVHCMELRVLGSSGLFVSRIGLGMASLGRPGYINLKHEEDLAGEYGEAAMEQKAHLVLDSAWDAGIRYFDVARSYGLAEKFLGQWLTSRSVSPPTVTVGSKWGCVGERF
jgi:aryl-alcohol dehydrogenase-like predicted oxidoreductase